MRPIMLALSSFRQSHTAIGLAIEQAKKSSELIVVYVVDVNLVRYLIGTDIGWLCPEVKDRCNEEILSEYREKAEQEVKFITRMAKDHRVCVRSYIDIGRFAVECLKVIEKEKPELVITTRSSRPQWVKKFFGSPVDYLVANAKCQVVEA